MSLAEVIDKLNDIGKSMDRLAPVRRITLTRGSAVSSGVDIFQNDDLRSLSKKPMSSIFRGVVAFSAEAVLSVRLDRAGSYLNLNSGSPLVAAQIFLFDLPVDEVDEVNFRVNASATVRRFTIDEVFVAGP